MRFNPFKPGNLFPPGIFKGRIDEINSLTKILFQTKNHNPQHFIIEGEKGIGKSSLMLFIQHLAKGQITFKNQSFKFLVVMVELTDSMTYADIIRQIATELKSEISRIKDVQTKAKDVWDFFCKWEVLGVRYYQGERVELSDFELLDQLALGLEKAYTDFEVTHEGILILIDEADKPSEKAKLGEIIKITTERLTKRDCLRICFGLSGLPTIVSKLRVGHEASPRIFQNFSLEPLGEKEREEVIEQCLDEAEQVNGFAVDINHEAKMQLSELSEGYPHFLQQFGYCAFDEDTDNLIDLNDVQQGLLKENGALDQLGHKYFAEMYFDKISSDNYRIVLNALAENSDTWIARSKIISDTALSASTVNNALKALKERNIIQSKEGQKGEYRIPTKSFAAWIKASAGSWAQKPRQS